MKLPTLEPTALLQKVADSDEIVKATIGLAVMSLLRRGAPVSREAITASLEAIASGERQAGDPNDLMAKGALRFMASLPPSEE